MQAKLIATLGAVILGGGAVAFALSSDTKAEPKVPNPAPAADENKTVERPPEMVGAAVAGKKKVVRKKKKKPEKFTLEEDNRTNSADRLLLPNGKSVPVLNGAFGAPKMDWPKDIPYSPIIKVEVDGNNTRWYVHEDGSKSKTEIVKDTVSGRLIPSTQVFNPKEAQPMDPDSLPKQQAKPKGKRKKGMRRGKGKGKGNGRRKNQNGGAPKK